MKGKDFEKLLVERHREYRELGFASIGRYGVQATRSKDEWIIIPSLPDFEGSIAPDGKHIIYDAKVCSQASFGLGKYRSETKGSRSRQLRHMLERSRFGAICFFLIHWPERILKTKAEPAITYRFPVDNDCDFWRWFAAGEIKSLTRADCEHYATQIEWNTFGRGTKPRPNFLKGFVFPNVRSYENVEALESQDQEKGQSGGDRQIKTKVETAIHSGHGAQVDSGHRQAGRRLRGSPRQANGTNR